MAGLGTNCPAVPKLVANLGLYQRVVELLECDAPGRQFVLEAYEFTFGLLELICAQSMLLFPSE
jgi:hypothetical protein